MSHRVAIVAVIASVVLWRISKTIGRHSVSRPSKYLLPPILPALHLPNEIWMLIFDYLDEKALVNVSGSSRFFHAISMDVLVRHLQWRSPERARQHLSTFWKRFPEQGRSVRSLTLQFVPFRRVQPVVFDIYADIFSAMQIFGNGLLRLVICGTALPDSFFEILNGLPRLRYLNLRQCIVPAAPNRLATPPPLETLALVDLTPRCYGVYSAYFVHLFNGLTTISIDHGPHEHDFQQLSVPPLECEPVRITLGAAAEQVSCTHYTTALSHFRLHALEELVIIIPGLSCWPFACYDNFPLEDVPCLATMPRLRTLMAPPHIVELLARKTSQLQSVAVQGPGLARVFHILGALERHGQSMQHLAINTRRWDDDLVPYISQRFPELQSLEILYHEDEPSERSLEVIGHNLRKLTKLNTLHIHRFPHGIYRPWKDHVDNYRQPSCQHRASNSIEPSTKLSDIGLVSTAVPTLVRVKLRHDFESGHGWARDNADSPWYESVYRVECTSAREIQEDMRTEYSPMGYYGALVLHHLAPVES